MSVSLQEQFQMWRNRIDASGYCLSNEAKDWRKYEEAYEGEIIDADKSDYRSHFSQPNLFYVDVRSTIPKLYSQNPYFYIDPETPEADLTAEVMEKVVNNLKENRWFLKQRMDELIKGAKLKGRAYIKVSYRFSKDKIGREFDGEEFNDEISLSYVDRENLLIDPNARSVDTARWVAHKIKAPIKDIRSKFNIKKDEKIATTEDFKDFNESKKLPNDEKEDFLYGCYYEIENREDHTLAIIVDGIDRFVEKPYQSPYAYHTMYVPLEWNDLPNQLNTKADLHFWYDELVNLANFKTQQLHHARKQNAKYLLQSSQELTDKQEEDLTSYIDSIVVRLSPGQTIVPFTHASLGQEVYLSEQALRQDITIISGMNEMKQGLPQTQKTAREAMAIVQESQDVISYRSGKVEQAAAEIIKKCVWLIQNFYDTTRIIAITGMQDVEYMGLKDKYVGKGMSVIGKPDRPFIGFVGKDLIGKMSVRVKAGSAMPVNEGQRKEDITQLIQLMGQFPQMASAVDTKELLKEIAKALHIENKNILFDAKSPYQENSLLKRNIPVMPNINEPHDEHIHGHELESNNTPAFIAHLLNHKLMKNFIDKSQPSQAPALNTGAAGPGELSRENISGMPIGSSVPPEAMPDQPDVAISNQAQPMPQASNIPN